MEMSSCHQEDEALLKECCDQIEEGEINIIKGECDCFISELRSMLKEKYRVCSEDDIEIRCICFDKKGIYVCRECKKIKEHKEHKKLDRIIEVQMYNQEKSVNIFIGVECKNGGFDREELIKSKIDNIKDKLIDFFNNANFLYQQLGLSLNKFCFLIYIIPKLLSDVNNINNFVQKLDEELSSKPFNNCTAVRVKGTDIKKVWEDLCSSKGDE
jgi:predicted RNA-binding protein YlxR (DUF448 family)